MRPLSVQQMDDEGQVLNSYFGIPWLPQVPREHFNIDAYIEQILASQATLIIKPAHEIAEFCTLTTSASLTVSICRVDKSGGVGGNGM